MLERLDETQWRIVRVRAEGALIPTVDDGDGTEFTFLGDGRFAGSTGCNRFFGKFTVREDGSLDTGPVGVTMMMCPDDRMIQERRVLDALEATAAVVEAGDAVELQDSAGATVLDLANPEL